MLSMLQQLRPIDRHTNLTLREPLHWVHVDVDVFVVASSGYLFHSDVNCETTWIAANVGYVLARNSLFSHARYARAMWHINVKLNGAGSCAR